MAETKGFYVGVKESVSLRKNLLESSKGIVQGLKDYERLKLVREEKHEKILEFKNKINEILALLSGLKEHFPKHGLREDVYLKSKTEKTKKGTKKIDIKTDEIEKLEKDLNEIESRLVSM